MDNDTNKIINILLLGETGVGKSTFINAFANYLAHETLEKARTRGMTCIIPCSFTLTDENYREKQIELGSDPNEQNVPGASATQQCKLFTFPFEGYTIQLIDTPGVGDTRGIDQDKINFDNIMTFIGKFKELHCICILLKPNNARITVTFEYCIKQLLAHLQKKASDNIVFLFTNTRSTFYRPGDTAPAVRRILDEVKKSQPYVDIPFDKSRIYCLDNEAFRFLAAFHQGMQFPDHEFDNFSKSWETSMKECRRLMQYIIGTEDQPGLVPHQVQETISVNEARRVIMGLTQPLAEISQNINDNLELMERHSKEVEMHSRNKKKLQQCLYVPAIELELIDLDQPRTVCAGNTCVEKTTVAGIAKIIYSQVCCDPCDLTGVARDVMGDSELKNCKVFDNKGYCTKCYCGYAQHLHIYYDTQVVEKKIINEEVSKEIVTEEQAQMEASRILDDIKNRRDKLRYEMRKISHATAKFSHFLRNNAIIPYNNAFKSYVQHLIVNRSGRDNRDTKSLKEMLVEHDQMENLLDNQDYDRTKGSALSVDDMFATIKDLYKLELYGEKIKESQERQIKARKAELKANTKVHTAPMGSIMRFARWLFNKGN